MVNKSGIVAGNQIAAETNCEEVRKDRAKCYGEEFKLQYSNNCLGNKLI